MIGGTGLSLFGSTIVDQWIIQKPWCCKTIQLFDTQTCQYHKVANQCFAWCSVQWITKEFWKFKERNDKSPVQNHPCEVYGKDFDESCQLRESMVAPLDTKALPTTTSAFTDGGVCWFSQCLVLCEFFYWILELDWTLETTLVFGFIFYSICGSWLLRFFKAAVLVPVTSDSSLDN